MAPAEQAKDFAGKMAELETLVNQLETGDLSLEESLQAFETGVQLIRECQNRLQHAEQKVSQLLEQDGQLTEQPAAGHLHTE
ncbi:exodeoxyribonuclease VII small subunit [Oceanospirillum sediminis]|uniref:Exodeoxyribonuclease 7 small subunit n=1 Tax=Oceanospirillum sediminis TaxID=2760088 RepID=A0A839IPQ1_9GAMM|nr:exodeoxyribonuclease VII small subunit [Oceanospirillum sediminis]MBB1486654.1 exodeoxyribonuclease VII small subunit [Oceanospirillum sediminis]